MSLSEIINILKLNNVTLQLQGEQLKLIGETASLTKELIAEIKKSKAELISFLKETNNSLHFQPIRIAPRALHYSLTGAQKRIWIACQFAGGSAAYTIVSSFYVKGIDVQLLQDAFKQLIQRHESLRTIFKEVEGEPRQFIQDEIDFAIEQADFKNVKNKAQKIAEEESCLQHNSFLLEHGPLIKVKLVELSETEHALLLSMHHIISDGWSIGILMHELMASYGATNELITADPPLNIQYKDYANWLIEKQERHHYAKESSYWKERLRHLPEPLSIPSDFVRPDVKKQEGAISRFYLKAEQYQLMQLLCKKLSISLFNFLHAATGIFLYKYTGQCRTIIGTAVSGRQHAELENQLGLYVNTLALLTETDPEKSIVDYLKETATAVTRDFQHQSYSFDQLVDTLMIKREAGRTPLFDVMLVLQNGAIAERSIRIGKENNIEIAFLDKHFYKSKSLTKLNRAAKFDLTFDFLVEEKDALRVELEYSTELFTEERICKLGNMFIHILSQMLKNPKKKINELELLNASERKKLLHQFNAPIKEINHWQLYDLLKPSFRRHKEKTALIYGKNKFSYKTIDEYSDQLAYYLTSKLPTAGNSLVGICMERTEWTLISILGVLKAGATYVPIDPNYPAARIEFMLEDADPEFIITDKKVKKNVPVNFRKRIIDINAEKETILSFPKQRIYPRDLREKTAYLIYTSGSTGKPKGVEICHRNVIAFLQWAKEEFKNTSFDLLYATTSYCFDLSIFEFFFPILTGKTIRLLNSAMEIVHFLPGDTQVMLNTVPSVVRNLLEEKLDLSPVSALNMAGEAVPKKFKQALPYSRIEVRNLYGPSEDTTYSTCYLFKEDRYDEIPIGKPISNTQLYILDEYLHLLPEGVDGEIYLSGQGIAKGYHGLPELTKEKFLNNPFVDGQLLYKTGDMGRWLPDGQVLFTGRVDDQVKIRGYRIELGEIQFRLEQIAGIEQAVVVVKEMQGDKHIIAYWKGISETNAEELKGVLVSQLPAYSVPSFFIRLENIPLNANGKVDKKMLPLPNESTLSIALVAPENETEIHLHALWKQVLPADSFGVNNNFFELGGHSLNATRLKILIHKELKKTITLLQLFQHPTIRQQAELLYGKEESIAAAIEKAPPSTFYPLSSTQQRLWVISQFEAGNRAYHMPGTYLMEGKLDVDALAASFNVLIARHEILRTVFKENEEGEVQQFILSPSEIQFELKLVDLQQEDNKEDVVRIEVAKQIEKCFDLSIEPPIRAVVYQLSAHQWVFAYVMHHIISDGWSMGIIINEVLELYNSYVEQRIRSLPSLEIQFKDYASWEQKQLTGEQLIHHKQYWLEQFEGEIPVLNLPSDKKRPAMKTYNGGIYTTRINNELTKKLKEFCQKKDGTLFIGLLSMVNAILYRYTNQEDIIIGMPVAGRELQQMENQIGCYVNTVALRNSVKGEENFNVLFENTKKQALQGYEHQAYPFEELLNAISLPHDLSRNALFDVMVSLEDNSLNDRIKELKGLKISKYESDLKINSKFDLSFDFRDSKEYIQFNTEYNSDVFSETFIHSFIQNFLRLMELLLDNPVTGIGHLDFLSHEERQTLLIGFNNTAVEYPKDKTVIDRFEEQVTKTPDQVALVFEDISLTYKELNEQSNQFGDYLRKHYKVKPDDLVGIKLKRSKWMLIALLGVLKSGAAYVPVDPTYPEDRINYILSDSKCKLLLDEAELDNFKKKQHTYGCENLNHINKASDLAYVIYTSGSTGRPKGVMIEHRNINSFLSNFSSRFFLNKDIVLGATTNYTFDISILELLGTLIQGIKLFLIPETNPESILNYIHSRKINALQLTPSRLQQLLEANEGKIEFLENLEVLVIGGEPMSDNSYRQLKKLKNTRAINVYGPTETCIWSSSLELKTSSSLTIGKPLLNEHILITNEELKLCPISVVGEICIGGDGLARGYLNNPGLTSEKFVTDPFNEHAKIYKTGDLGKWLPDGTIEFIGRKDNQVKVRGYRIELGEIENMLQQYTGISSAHVTIKVDETTGDTDLIAYFVSKEKLETADIRNYLTRSLPLYMLPSYYVQLEVMPLTSSGKIDKKELPIPEKYGIVASKEYIAPRTETEKKLEAIWTDILIKDKIGVKDNFFELGGQSLKVTRLSARIYKEFDRKFEIKELFDKPVLEEQALLIQESGKIKFAAIPVSIEQNSYPLSSSQRRIWILSQLEGGNTAYNESAEFVFEGLLNFRTLELSINKLIDRHEILRTIFKEGNAGDIRQFIIPGGEEKLNIDYRDLRKEENAEIKCRELIREHCTKPFDLSMEILLRAGLYQITDSRWIFSCVMHHIISDGWSLNIIIKELLELYKSPDSDIDNLLPPLRIQYKDYADWQQTQLKKKTLNYHADYWLKQFKDELPILEMPIDKARPAIKTYNGNKIYKLLSSEVNENLKSFCQNNGCTLFMGLFSVVNVLLYKYTHQEDIIIGTPVAGRDHIDLENQIGFYVNTLALRTRFKGEDSYRELLENTREVILDAFRHQAYPFDELVDELGLYRDMSRSPLFDVMITLHDLEMNEGPFKWLDKLNISKSKKAENEALISKFDITFDFVEFGGGLHTEIGYNSDIFKKTTIERIANHFLQLTQAIVESPDIAIKSLEFLSSNEKQLLEEFNNTKVEYPANKTVIHFLEEQAERTPENIALLFDNVPYTYKEVNEKTNQFARYLRKYCKISRNELVGVKLNRSQWSIISILAVLKSGGAYVPIDIEYPKERIDLIVSESRCKVVIDDDLIEEFEKKEKNFKKDNITRLVIPEDLAYVIYTSGSTGRPKGVMIEHSSLIDYVLTFSQTFNVQACDRCIQQSSFSFDTHIEEIYPILINGGTIIIGKNGGRDIDELKTLIQEKNVTIVTTTPLVLKELNSIDAKSDNLRLIISGGDVFNLSYVSNYIEKIQIYDTYGPTESTVCSTFFKINDSTTPLIGKPINNRTIWILSDHDELCPIGVIGEICIGGSGLARGYLNNPELTAEKFVHYPLKGGKRIYKTGDLGRWLDDGNIEFIGRKDDQVKIRGYRIELGEIENIIHTYQHIESATVQVRLNNFLEKELVAYIVSKQQLNTFDLRSYLSEVLPAYMLPRHYVQLEQLPLTPNGKLNKKELPPIDRLDEDVEYVEPVSIEERNLVIVCEEVLKKSCLSINADFFALGGDSIKSIQIVSRLRQRGYKLTIQNVLLHPILRNLAEKMEVINLPIDQALVKGNVPLGPIQRMFFEHQSVDLHHFNQSVLLISKNEISKEGIKNSLNKLLLHHDALRLVYHHTASGWIQENRVDNIDCWLEFVDASTNESFQQCCDRIQSSINIEQGPLFKACLFSYPNENRLLLVAHHLIVDAVSWQILFEDLTLLYKQYLSGRHMELPLKTNSFKDWQIKQVRYSMAKSLENEEPHWSKIENIAIKPLFKDYPEGKNLVGDGETQSFLLDKNETSQLLNHCYKAYSTNVNDLLVTALNLALKEVLGATESIIFIEGHGREDIGENIDVSRTVGWFTSIYPVYFNLKYSSDTIRQLIEVKESLHHVPNKGIGYGILRYLNRREYKLETEIVFNYLGDYSANTELIDEEQIFVFSKDYRSENISKKRERDAILDFSCIVVAGKMQVILTYSNNQYTSETINKLLESIKKGLLELIKQLSHEGRRHLTPVDLTYKNINPEELIALNKDLQLEDIYTLSPLQEGLYYHWLTDPLSSAYFEQLNYKLRGILDIEALKESYQKLINRHAILRTYFTHDIDDIALQIVNKNIEPIFQYLDVSHENNFSLNAFKEAELNVKFNLEKGALMRLTVLRTSNNIYEFIWSHHHILMDGWCMGVLIREFYQFYQSLAKGEVPKLNKVPPYSSYIKWLSTVDTENSILYWKNYLSGYTTLSTLPKENLKTTHGYKVCKLDFLLDSNTEPALKNVCRELSITENTFIQTAWGILLSKYNNTNDVVFGTVVSGRPAEIDGIEEMIGLFINTIPVRICIKDHTTIIELLLNTQQESIKGAEHHYVQLAHIQSISESENNLFDHIVQFQNYPVQTILEREISENPNELSLLSVETVEQNNYDFTFVIIPGDVTRFSFMYNSEVYSPLLIDQLKNHFLRITEQLTERSNSFIHEIDLLSAEEKLLLTEGFNNAKTGFSGYRTIVGLFEAQVAKTPDKVAVIFGDISLSYKELDNKANRISKFLRENYKIEIGDLVGLMLDRSEESIISILGILKSGGAYVPIDPDYPKTRKEFIINDTKVKVLITKTEHIFDLPDYTGNIFAIDVQVDGIDNCIKLPAVPIQENNLVYVMYTSGSTGNPKGVLVEHRNVVRLVKSTNYVDISETDVILSLSNFSFDGSVFDIFGALLNGASLVIPSKDAFLDLNVLCRIINENDVSIFFITTALFNSLADNGPFTFNKLKYVLFGGERVSVNHVRKFRSLADQVNLVHVYGPTENTTFSSYYKVTEIDEKSFVIPIGRAISDSKCYILNEQFGCKSLSPIGAIGEIYVGGEGLSRGYLNQQQLTSEKFIANPFKSSELIYKTGDLGKLLPDGNIEFIGRKDDQVKIRGHRIELGEIENILQKYPDIDCAIVLVREGIDAEKTLIAYLVSKNVLSTSDIRAYLSKILPAYMLPTYYVIVDELPLTPNGKIDKRKLPDPEEFGRDGCIEYVEPRNETENKLVLIWEEIFGKGKVSINDDFFDLGGHSLRVTRLISMIHKGFSVRLELKQLFETTVLTDQAELIRQAQNDSYMSIPLAEEQSSYPLSSSQQRLWILSQFEGGNLAYNMPAAYVFEGEIKYDALNKAFSNLILRHEILRTVFKEDEKGRIRQFISPPETLEFKIEYQNLDYEECPEIKLKNLVESNLNKPFDLSEGPLLRSTLFKLSESKWVFTCVMHHIISDGWSMNILIDELLKFYNKYATGKENSVQPLRIQYKDYAVWQQTQLSNNSYLHAHKEYWLNQFEGDLPLLKLPGDKIRPSIKAYNGAVVNKKINSAFSKEIKAFGQEQGVTLFMQLFAVVNVLLYRYTNQEDIVIGSPIAGRTHADLEDQIGFYVNTIPLRTRFNGHNNFIELLENVKEVTLKAYEHQLYPFDELVNNLSLKRDMSRNALFDVMIVLQNTEFSDRKKLNASDGIQINKYEAGKNNTNKFDLTFDFYENGDEIFMEMEYDSDIYNDITAKRLANHFEQLLVAAIKNPTVSIQQLDYLTATEKQQLTLDFNNSAAVYPQNKTIIDLFETQAIENPDGIALIFEDTHLTYSDLNKLSNQLSHYLQQKYEIEADDLIGIRLERSEWMIISILGILKSGGAYVPIDPDYPEDRINFILKDSKCKVVIDKEELRIFDKAQPDYSDKNPLIKRDSTDLAYVIYTSGSTGQPKGCMLEHRGVVNRLSWMLEYYGLTKNDIFFQKTTYTFDVSVWEIFMPLCFGARMVLCSDEVVKSPDHIISLIEKQKISCLHFVPSMLSVFIATLFDQKSVDVRMQSLKYVFTSGEALLSSTVKAWYVKVSVPIYNLYGPTEASIEVAHYATNKEDSIIPIGSPIWNTQLYILGNEYELLPIGVIGEICIGGHGLARGYLNRPELTEEKFVNNPFKSGEKIYKTGDLGRWLNNGNIEYIGRKDDQVKIRGYRIELGEIESRLLDHEKINAASVIARTNSSGDKDLIAYIVSKEDLSKAFIRNYLSQLLPAYMIPSYYVKLESMPLTTSGKVDKKALPNPEDFEMSVKTDYIKPRTEIEEKLTWIWKEILGKEKISINDDFFDLGGHSLKSIHLVNKIYKEFDVKLKLKDVFTQYKLEDQAELISKAKKTKYIAIEPAPIHEHYDLSPSQNRLWIIDQMGMEKTSYNMYGTYTFRDGMDLELFKLSIKKLIERHEILRTVFIEVGGVPKQKIINIQELNVRIQLLDLSAIEDAKVVNEDVYHQLFNHEFNLDTWPLFKLLFIKEQTAYKLLFCMHHIISDGWSMELFLRDIVAIYQGEVSGTPALLPDLKIQYKDYSDWQNGLLAEGNLSNEEEYWKSALAEPLPDLRLPYDYEITSPSNSAEQFNLLIDEKLKKEIDQFLSVKKSSIFALFIACFKVMLNRITGETDLITAIPVANRNHDDIKDLVGFFLNTLMLRNQLDKGNSFEMFLDQVNVNLINGLENQSYPFEKLLDRLPVRKDYNRFPISSVCLNMLNFNSTEQAFLQYETEELNEDVLSAKFDLECYFKEYTNGISINCIYKKCLFKSETIRYWMDGLVLVLKQVVKNEKIQIKDIRIFNKPLYKITPPEPSNQFDFFEDDFINQSIVSKFEEQVKKRHGHTAIEQNGEILNYSELNSLSNGLAEKILGFNKLKNSNVALLIEHGKNAIVGILGTLKSGNTYVPLDIAYPEERIKYILKDTNSKIIITTSENFELATRLAADFDDISILNISDDIKPVNENPDIIIDPDQNAYILYTSGSTGQPKGVIQSHRNVLHFNRVYTNNLHICENDKVSLLPIYSFDSSVMDIYGALLNGASIHPYNIRKDGIQNLAEWLLHNKISIIHTAPTIYRYFISVLDSVVFKDARLVVLGGEAVYKKDFDNFKKHFPKHSLLINGYGPTESTITLQKFLDHKSIITTKSVPIGYPVQHTKIYILGNNNEELGIYEVGEIVYRSNFLALGYLNNKEQTNAVFTKDPFANKERVYRSGDLGRILPNGEIEFMGRKDDQVKINGYRIELEEIENAMQSHPDIDSVVVVTKENKEEQNELVAYIISKRKLSVIDIYTFLSKMLPTYMLPSHYVHLENWPLTPNGKVDRKKLPDPAASEMKMGTEYINPRNEIEKRLLSMWKDVLEREDDTIGIEDNFFLLGGNSMKVIKLHKLISEIYPGSIQVPHLFNYPTIAGIAKLISNHNKENMKDSKNILQGQF